MSQEKSYDTSTGSWVPKFVRPGKEPDGRHGQNRCERGQWKLGNPGGVSKLDTDSGAMLWFSHQGEKTFCLSQMQPRTRAEVDTGPSDHPSGVNMDTAQSRT